MVTLATDALIKQPGIGSEFRTYVVVLRVTPDADTPPATRCHIVTCLQDVSLGGRADHIPSPARGERRALISQQ